MARIRSIKPAIWTDSRFVGLSRDARLLFIGMVSNADDDGRLIGTPIALIGAVFPQDPLTVKQITRWRDEIEAAGLIQIYTSGNGTYICLPNWSKHQYIQKRTASTLPTPPPLLATGSSNGTRTGAMT